MSTMYRSDPDFGPTVEHADAAYPLDDDDLRDLERVFCAMARLPLRYEVWYPSYSGADGEGEWRSVVRLIEEHTTGLYYVAWISDCFDPPLYLVRGESFEDAYDEFLVDPKIEEHLKVDPSYASDYGDPDSWTYNDNGVHIDSEAVMLLGGYTYDRIRLRGA